MTDKPKVEKSSERKGRAKGTPNKRTQDVIERLAELKCDPIEGMALIATDACECLVCKGTGKIGKDDNIESCEMCFGSGKRIASLELKGQMYKELAQYIAPKRKAIEMTGANGEDLVPKVIKIVYE